MTKAFSLKAKNKPTLFSFDLETEFKKIDRCVFDNRNYARRDLEREVDILKSLAKDYIEIINTNTISNTHLQNLRIAIIEGPSGIWENAANKLERLSYHFKEARNLIIELMDSPKVAVIEKALSCTGDGFEIDQLQTIINNIFQHKSKRLRIKASNVAFRSNKTELLNLLQQILK